MFASTDFGQSWKAVPASGIRSVNRFRSYNYFIQSGTNFLMGMDELGVLRSADNGHHWNQSIAGFTAASTIDNCLLALHDTMLSGTHSDGIYGTINNGNAWIKVGTRNNKDTLSNAIIFTLLRPAPNILLAGTGGDGLYRTADNGRTWKHITTGLPFTQFGNYETDNGLAKSGNNILLATTKGIYYSTNNGVSWQASNLTGDRMNATAIAANGSIAVAGVAQGVFPFQSGIYRSVNNGITWTLVTGNIRDIVSLAADGSNTFYAGTFSNNWRSANNGISWAQIGTGIPQNTGGYAIKVVNTTNVFIGNDKGIYFSNNSGNSFTNVSAGLDAAPNNAVQGIEANSTFLFAGLFQNGVWKRPLSDFGIISNLITNNEKTNLQNKEQFPVTDELSIYPNPAVDYVTIVSETNRPGTIQIRIIDNVGKIVLQSNEYILAGVYSKTFDVSNFAQGTYFVELIDNGKINSRKMVVTKQ